MFVNGDPEKSEVTTTVSTCRAQKLGLYRKLPEGVPGDP